jgi:chromosome segregation protein
VYLKSLTLRGFKSFASTTNLVFEPGITCVVGPNGSGKSNVVDAIAWVMGEQGAKSLRGGKMEDVIFAGTSGRAPLGRAEVALTIDNSDGALPIDYSEVTITRTMFRNGGSDYQINGEACRLLDVQELLSDSGIGREMHVIIGQGRLDAILHASPEDRRGFIEEAAGVLKHRKRKEKALRKLDAMSANLTRLNDLTAELRRQLKPLGRQAELARRALVIQADLRDARLRLLADDVATLTAALTKEEADEHALRTRQQEVERELQVQRAEEHSLEESVAADAPMQARAQDTFVALAAARERFAGLRSVAAERVRNAPTAIDAAEGPDPEVLEQQAREAHTQQRELEAQVAHHAGELASRVALRDDLEKQLREAETAEAEHRRAVAQRSDGFESLRRQLAAARSRHETRAADIQRLRDEHRQAVANAEQAQVRYQELESSIGGLDEGEQGLDRQYSEAQRALAGANDKLADVREALATAEQRQTALAARVEALRMGLQSHDGSAALLAADERVSGLLGNVAALLRVASGYEVAIGAALGAWSDAVALRSVDDARKAIEFLAETGQGKAHLLVDTQSSDSDIWPELPHWAVYATDVIEADSLGGALRRILQRVAVVDDLDAAQALVDDVDVTAVTKTGEMLSRGMAVGGHSESLVEVQAALSEAESAMAQVTHDIERLTFDVAAATNRRDEAQSAAEAVLDLLHDSDARMSAVAEELGTLGSAVRSAQIEADRLLKAQQAAQVAADDDLVTVEDLQRRVREAEEAPELVEPDPEVALSLRTQLATAKEHEVSARLDLRTMEERRTAATERVSELQAAAARVRQQRQAQAEQRAQRMREAAVASDVLRALDSIEPFTEQAVLQAQRERDELEGAKLRRDARLRELRATIRELLTEADRLNDSVHRDEMAKAEQRMRIESAQEKALADFGVDPETLIAEYGPDQLIAPSAVAVADAEDHEEAATDAVPYDRDTQEARARKAERELAALGRVNPLALEEFDAMQERQAFLSAQLEDLKKGRDDLLGIVTDVDERVREVFTEAYADVAVQFQDVFSRLFPGGEGRLILTNPDDMLTTGIEVEARPPGKKIKRLSLLSGGERSLTAVAFLVALFKARPSPFYLLDEVEAALDDVNLGRLIGLLTELRDTSQLLVITHQKRTMEMADALYGVTMRDGVTSVISQRLRETA